jgi:hypothetical protein
MGYMYIDHYNERILSKQKIYQTIFIGMSFHISAKYIDTVEEGETTYIVRAYFV